MKSLIYPTTNDKMAYEQNLKLNDDVVKKKKSWNSLKEGLNIS